MATVSRNSRWVIWISVATGLILNVDQSSVILVLGQISDQFGTGLSDSQWILSSYLLPLASLVVVGGVICDRYSTIKVLFVGLIIFLIGSILSSVSQELMYLLSARILCGVGAALAFPASLALIRKCLSEDLAKKAFGYWFAGALGGSAAGPLLNGFLVDLSNWRVVFLVSSVISILILVGLMISNLSIAEFETVTKISFFSSLVTTLALTGIVFGLIRAGNDGWTSGSSFFPILVGLLIFVIKVIFDQYLTQQNKSSSGKIGAAWPFIYLMLAGILPVVGVVVLTVLYLGSVRDLSVFQTGLAITPFGVSAALLSPLVPRLVSRYGFGRLLIIAVVFQFFGLISLTRLEANSSFFVIAIGLFGLGISMAIFPSLTLNEALTYTPEANSGYISGIHNGAIQVGQLISIGLIGSLATININNDLRTTFSSGSIYIPESGYKALTSGEEWLPEDIPFNDIERFRELADASFTSGLAKTTVFTLVILIAVVVVSIVMKKVLNKNLINRI